MHYYSANKVPRRFFAEQRGSSVQVSKKQNQDISNPLNFPTSIPDVWDVMSDFRKGLGMIDNMFPFRSSLDMAPMETSWKPRADITSTKEGYQIHAELPGVPKDNVKV